MTKIMRTLRDVDAEVRSESQSTEPIGLVNDYTYGNLNDVREDLEDKASNEALIDNEFLNPDDSIESGQVRDKDSQAGSAASAQNQCVPGSDYLGGKKNENDLAGNRFTDTGKSDKLMVDSNIDDDDMNIEVERDIIITDDEIIDITMVSVPEEGNTIHETPASSSQKDSLQASQDKTYGSSDKKSCSCSQNQKPEDLHQTQDRYKDLDDSTLEKMKERYPVEQVIADEDEVVSVKDVQPCVDEMNVDKNTRERG